MASQMSGLRWTALALCGVAFLLLLVVQFIPFAGFTTSFFGATADADAYAWEAKFRAEGFGEESTEQTSWYDNDFDDDDGIGMVRAAAPLLAAGLVVSVLAVIFLLRIPAGAGAAALVAAMLTGLGVFLMARGIGELFDDQQDWAVGFYLAIAAAVLCAVAGVLALVGGQRSAQPPSAF